MNKDEETLSLQVNDNDEQIDSLFEMLRELINKSIQKNVFDDLDNYSNIMTISQVIKYFNRHGMDSFTKTMIQNYVRVGVLQQPEEKRYYKKNHLFALAMIDSLKGSYSLEEIKDLFELLKKYGDNDLKQPEDAYIKYSAELENALTEISKEDVSVEKATELLPVFMAKSVLYKHAAQSLTALLKAKT